MNRYAKLGMLRDMRAGKDVVYVAPTSRLAREAWVALELEVRLDRMTVVRRSSGREAIERLYGPGRIRFIAAHSARGVTGEVFVIAADLAGAELEHVMPATVGAEVVRAAA